MWQALFGNMVGLLSLGTILGSVGVVGFWTWRAMR